MNFYIFRADKKEDVNNFPFYMAEIYPLEHNRGNDAKRTLSELADNLVERQLKYLRDCNMTGDEYFPFNFVFSVPYEVRMQRNSMWYTSELTSGEKKRFLDQMKSHYLKRCDPHAYDIDSPDDSTLI